MTRLARLLALAALLLPCLARAAEPLHARIDLPRKG